MYNLFNLQVEKDNNKIKIKKKTEEDGFLIRTQCSWLGSCLLWVMSTEISVDIAVDVAVDTRLILGRQFFDTRSALGRQSVDIAVNRRSIVVDIRSRHGR